MEEINTAAMMDGVAKSAVFVLFLNAKTLTRPYVLKEVRMAMSLKKDFLVLTETDPRHGAVLNNHGEFEFSASLNESMNIAVVCVTCKTTSGPGEGFCRNCDQKLTHSKASPDDA